MTTDPGPGRAARVLRTVPEPGARARVVVLPHAGAGPQALAPLIRAFPGDVEVVGVTLPGRERRNREPHTGPASDPAAFVRGLAAELRDLSPVPTVLLGHSLGAALAGTLAAAEPEAFTGVLLSSPPAPGTPLRCAGRFSDAELLDILAAGGAGAVPFDDPGWTAALLALLRSDLTLAARLGRVDAHLPVRVPVTLVSGRSDVVAGEPGLAFWRTRSAAGVRSVVLDGGHFHLLAPANVPIVVAEALQVLGPSGTAAAAA